MNRLKKIVIMMVLMAVCITAIPIPAQAASAKNKKAHTAYQKQLKKNKKKWKKEKSKIPYAYEDLDGDGIDELIVQYKYEIVTEIYIYTYKKGKIKQISSYLGAEWLNLKNIKYYKKSKVLYVYYPPAEESATERYYKLGNNKYKSKCGSCVSGKKYYDCSVNGKTKSASAYKKYVKSLVKNSKAKSFNKLKWKKY